MDGMYGYNQEKARLLLSKAYDAHYSLFECLSKEIQKNFVDKMAECWFCKEAQEFFKIFKEKFDQLATETNNKLARIDGVIDLALSKWDVETQTDLSKKLGTPFAFPSPINISNIQENFNGIRGIHRDKAKEAISYLSKVKELSNDKLSNLRKACYENEAFLGAGQQQQLEKMIESITNQISKVIEENINNLEYSINLTIDKYGDIASEVAGKFTV